MRGEEKEGGGGRVKVPGRILQNVTANRGQ